MTTPILVSVGRVLHVGPCPGQPGKDTRIHVLLEGSDNAVSLLAQHTDTPALERLAVGKRIRITVEEEPGKEEPNGEV